MLRSLGSWLARMSDDGGEPRMLRSLGSWLARISDDGVEPRGPDQRQRVEPRPGLGQGWDPGAPWREDALDPISPWRSGRGDVRLELDPLRHPGERRGARQRLVHVGDGPAA